jgi:hypothetical protein
MDIIHQNVISHHRTPPNTTELLKTTTELLIATTELLKATTELLKATTERITTITEHLQVTTEHIFFITIREFLISCWETKFYHKTSKNDEHFFFITMCTFSSFTYPKSRRLNVTMEKITSTTKCSCMLRQCLETSS